MISIIRPYFPSFYQRIGIAFCIFCILIIKITLRYCRKSVKNKIGRSETLRVDSCFFTRKSEVCLWWCIDMKHMRKHYRYDSEILRKEYKPLSRRIELLDRSEDPAALWSESVCTDMDIAEFFFRRDTRREARVFETEESIIYTFIESILFLTSDTTTRCYNFPFEVERDEYGIFTTSERWEFSRKVRKRDHSLFSQVCFEGFSDELVHIRNE